MHPLRVFFKLFACCFGRLSGKGLFSCNRLDLRSAEESGVIYRTVSLAPPDQRAAEKSLAAVHDLIAQLAPSAPCSDLFRDTGGGFRALDGRGIDRLGFGRQSCAVQRFREGKPALAVQAPCPEHNHLEIPFHLVYLLCFLGSGRRLECSSYLAIVLSPVCLPP